MCLRLSEFPARTGAWGVEVSESNVLLRNEANDFKWFPLVFDEPIDGAEAAQVSTWGVNAKCEVNGDLPSVNILRATKMGEIFSKKPRKHEFRTTEWSGITYDALQLIVVKSHVDKPLCCAPETHKIYCMSALTDKVKNVIKMTTKYTAKRRRPSWTNLQSLWNVRCVGLWLFVVVFIHREFAENICICHVPLNQQCQLRTSFALMT